MSVRVQREDFDPGAEIARLAAGRRDVGGLASFIGVVRGEAGDTPVLAMTLEHYPAMTERMLAAIEAEARRRWPILDCRIVHRVGRLLPGERIVLVAVASSHRAAAFEACQFLTDWLKTQAPFWKLEETPSGERWVEANPDDDTAAARWDNLGSAFGVRS